MNSSAAPATTPAVETLLIELRDFTRPLHQALEETLDLTNPGLDLRGYAEILAIFSRYMDPWEVAVGAALPVHLQSWFDARRRAQMLRRDLEAIPLDLDTQWLTGAPQIFIPKGTAQALGSMYVFEGSTLGAQTFVEQLASRLGIEAEGGLDFFSGHRERTGRMWRDFRQTLQREVKVDEFSAAINAAGETFKTFRSMAILAKTFKAPSIADLDVR